MINNKNLDLLWLCCHQIFPAVLNARIYTVQINED